MGGRQQKILINSNRNAIQQQKLQMISLLLFSTLEQTVNTLSSCKVHSIKYQLFISYIFSFFHMRNRRALFFLSILNAVLIFFACNERLIETSKHTVLQCQRCEQWNKFSDLFTICIASTLYGIFGRFIVEPMFFLLYSLLSFVISSANLFTFTQFVCSRCLLLILSLLGYLKLNVCDEYISPRFVGFILLSFSRRRNGRCEFHRHNATTISKKAFPSLQLMSLHSVGIFFCYVSYNAYFVFPYSLNEAFPLKIYFVVIFFAGVVVICRVSSRFLEKCIFVHYFQTVVAFTSQFCVQSQRVRYTTRRQYLCSTKKTVDNNVHF